jgi:hypothetical protein
MEFSFRLVFFSRENYSRFHRDVKTVFLGFVELCENLRQREWTAMFGQAPA